MKRASRWEIIQVRLEEGLGPLPGPPQAEGAFVVFWWHSLPLGHMFVLPQEFPLSAADVVSRAAQIIAPALAAHLYGPLSLVAVDNRDATQNPGVPSLEALVQLQVPLHKLPALPAQPSSSARVSVIVCTARRPDQLRVCLARLQELNPAPAEILVVDNDPDSDATVAVVRSFDGVSYVAEPRRGLSYARNTGVRHASGDIIAFTDDDVRVHPEWLLGIRAGLARANVAGLTGLVLPAELESEAQMDFERILGFNRGYKAILFDEAYFKREVRNPVPVWELGAGANMAFRRSVFEKIGLFDVRLGAGASGCSEDSEFWYRMLSQGLGIIYEPRAVVWHSHRVSPEALCNQMQQYMRGHLVALLVQYERHRHVANLRRAFLSMPRYFFKQAKRVRSRRGARLWKAQISGYLWGFFTYLRIRGATRLPMLDDEARPLPASRADRVLNLR